MLLIEATSKMRSKGYHFAVLHCSKDLIPLYRSVGYVSAPIKFTHRVFGAQRLPEESGQQIHKYDHRDPILSEELIRLHRSSNERFNGCVVRDNPDYWAYVSFNLPNGGYWLENVPQEKDGTGNIPGRRGTVSAFAALRRAKVSSGFILSDFFADAATLKMDGGSSVLRQVTNAWALPWLPWLEQLIVFVECILRNQPIL